MKGKKILLGITGSIAAYKAAILIRLLVKEGAEVKVIMTPLAKEFITPLTIATLSKNPILVDFFNPENGDWNSHVDLGMWADVYLIAPATANTLAKMATGVADNLLLTSYLSAKCPVFFAPAMDLDMFQHPTTQRNIRTLQSIGNHFIEPTSGELASGLVGQGRMAEPEAIVEKLKHFFVASKTLIGKRFLVTAGPTYERIDPVRFIGNFSSGKMGFAIAEELADNGAEVILVAGPVNVTTNHNNIKLIKVISAIEMYDECTKVFPEVDGAIMSAAVADFCPANYVDKKIKRKASTPMTIKLKNNPDIAATLGKMKTEKQILVGFALETNDEVKNAQLKIQKKNLDFIVLNSLNEKGAGFQHDTNKITIIDKSNNLLKFDLKSKKEVAQDIVSYLLTFM